MSYDFLHEVETVTFRSPAKRPVEELLPVFKDQGYSIQEDVISLDREDSFPPWQHPSISEVEVQCNGTEVFGFTGENWDVLHLRYLFASLPYHLAERFVATVAETSLALKVAPEYRSRKIDTDALRSELSRIKDQLLQDTGEEPGSEGLAILVNSTYPRR